MKTDNELIAEFMGHSIHAFADSVTYFEDPAKQKHFGNPMREQLSVKLDLKYHESWDWLMPVVEKIEGLQIPEHLKKSFNGTINTDIKVAYSLVVEFIKWHNQQPK